MTDRPIIFSAPMVRALLSGRKTQTRRLATSPLRRCEVGDRLYVRERCWIWGHWRKNGLNKLGRQRWRFVAHRDHLTTFDPDGSYVATKAMHRGTLAFWSRPSIHMPRWASRMTLIVEDVRFERLVGISDGDALAEGVKEAAGAPSYRRFFVDRPGGDMFISAHPAECFARLWGSLHTADGERWSDHPEVVALTFRVERGNIDRLGKG